MVQKGNEWFQSLSGAVKREKKEENHEDCCVGRTARAAQRTLGVQSPASKSSGHFRGT